MEWGVGVGLVVRNGPRSVYRLAECWLGVSG